MAKTHIVDFAIFAFDIRDNNIIDLLKKAKEHNVTFEIMTWDNGNGLEGVRFRGKKSNIISFGMETLGFNDEQFAEEYFFG